jgi:RecA/RadA recombinase
MKTEDVKKALRKERKKRELAAKDFVSTGSTLLNLACTGHPDRGFAKGHYYFVVGDSISGKTWLSLTCLAEASINKNFGKHRFIFDNGEEGALMSIGRFFGKRVAERLEEPDNGCSYSIEDFYYNVDDALKANKPFIYILDSMDSLSSEQEGVYFDKTKKQRRAGKDEKEIKGSYGDGKAKVNSAMLRRVIGKPLQKSGSILIIINQTRDNPAAGMFESKKTRSGGKSLKFYACVELWASVAAKITKTIMNKKRQLGVYSKIVTKKNRLTGRERSVIVPIYHSFGFDDIGSCIDYLLDEGYWNKGKSIKAKGLGIEGSRNKIIKLIQQQDLEKDLRELVADVWNEIEDACTIKRKKRYV